MKIAHFNTNLNGGAAIAARRIFTGLKNVDVEQCFIYKIGKTTDPLYVKCNVSKNTRSFLARIENRIRNKKIERARQRYIVSRPVGLEAFSPSILSEGILLSDLNYRPDIVHLHWIGGMFDYESFFNSIPDTVPFVWTLHDMNPFTGGCHYSNGCKSYVDQCGNCPQLANSEEEDLSRTSLKAKLRSLKDREVHVVAGSHWLEGEARNSYVFKEAASIRTIHCSVDSGQLRPRNKVDCKKALGINHTQKVIAFGTDNIIPRKGAHRLMEALKIVYKQNENIVLIRFGVKPAETQEDESIKIIDLGYLMSIDLQAAVYSAADVFVMPSLYEAFGQVALESMACGTPVVAFDTGGPRDFVKNGQTGFLAEWDNTEDLANKILMLLEDEKGARNMGRTARQLVEKEFTLEHQAEKYSALYKEIA
jgi:glycosyltransferase involved in cell wall biosynthesis